MAASGRAQVTWRGDLMSGSGTIDERRRAARSGRSTSAGPRAPEESPSGKTSPEELIAAAHASCFSMALSNGLAKAGTPPERLEFGRRDFVPGDGITTSLDVVGTFPASTRRLREAAEDAKGTARSRRRSRASPRSRWTPGST